MNEDGGVIDNDGVRFGETEKGLGKGERRQERTTKRWQGNV
jgi:hypothetical protein